MIDVPEASPPVLFRFGVVSRYRMPGKRLQLNRFRRFSGLSGITSRRHQSESLE